MSIKLTRDEFIIKSRLVHSDKYDYSLSDYINNITKVIIICPIHGQFLQAPSHHIRGFGCKACGDLIGKSKQTHGIDYILIKFNKVHSNKYLYDFTGYINSHSKIRIICPIHGEFYQLVYSHTSGFGCDKCSSSKGELCVQKILDLYNVKYYIQYKFMDCKNIYQLSFDFYLPDYNLLIEYDGEQHYKVIVGFGGILSFERIQKNDKIKTDYCLNNNIELLRIPYWDFNNIEKILKEKIPL